MKGLSLSLHTIICIMFSCLFYITALDACEYVYPVAYAHTPYGLRILLIYQDVAGKVSLYTWDPATKVVRKGMPSHYDPSHVTILPDESGFSFIDNGILKIKKFAKRSARTIEMLDPLHSLFSINWIDNNKACVSGKRRSCYEIFEIDFEGTVELVIALDGTHCLYPQKINDSLFYIEWDQKTNNNRISCIDYPKIERISLGFNNDDHFDYRVQRIIQNDFNRNIYECSANLSTRTLLCDLKSKQVIDFTMVSESWGLVTVIREQDGVMGQCSCFEIKKINDRYILDMLFDFTIPIFTSRSFFLYESFMPLLPTLDKDRSCIYFSNVLFDYSLSLFSYDCSSQEITCISFHDQNESHFFKALPTPEGVWYGGSISSQKGGELSYSALHMWVNEDQMVCLQLPKVGICL